MAEFTKIPHRPLASFARTLRKERDMEHHEVSVAQLLQILQCKFEQEEEAISAALLHYQDSTLQNRLPKPQVQFASQDESAEAGNDQLRPPRRVYPVTPQRPDPTALAKLMEVSYTEWSESSYEDTTGDSKLAQWLASFAKKELNLSDADSAPKKMSQGRTARSTAADNPGENIPIEDSFNSGSSNSFLLPAFASTGHSPYSQRLHPNVSLHSGPSPRRRALSDPPTPSKRTNHQVHSRLRSTSHSAASPQEKWLFQTSNSNESADGSPLQAFPFLKPSTFSPLAFKFLRASEADDRSPSIAETPLTPSTNPNQSPVRFLRSPPPRTPLRHAVRFEDLDEHSLADLSRVHAFNLSLQHSTKSPFLIRTWKRMLGELTGRFPLGDKGPMIVADENEGMGMLDFEEPAVDEALGEESRSYSSLEPQHGSIETSPFVDIASSKPGMPSFQTHADVLLDREYASYLRGSISTKQKEIRSLQDLIAHREKTIEHMEFALKRRALEVLGSHEV